MLPFYLDYYINFVKVDKIVIYDGDSTDNTHEILKQYPQVELIIQKQDGQNDQYLKDTKNNSWKKYKDDYDWVIVCDIDEFLYHPNIQEKLSEYKNNGISIPITKGYDMITLNFPEFIKGNYLPNIITRGISDNHWMGKKIIFDPQKIEEINYRFGCHDCDPIGDIKYSHETELFMLHYKWLSHYYLTKRYKFLSERRSEWNIQHDAGKHFVTNSQITLNEYMEKYNSSTNVLKMEHFFDTIDGWFDFKEFYTQMVNKFPTGSHFVEIGAWLGKSTSYMTVEIINSGKNIKFDVIDTWEGSKNFVDEEAYKINADPYEVFTKNLSRVKDYINPIKGSSDVTYELYENESLDFVFIDAGHDYISVKNDIKNWYPKVKKNGIIAGHDYYVYPDVKKAVDEYFGNNIRLDDSLRESCGTWIVEKENFENLKSIEIDNKIENIWDLEEIKILQLSELENFMKIEKEIPFIKNEKIIHIKNIDLKNGKCERLIPYLINKGYKIKDKNDNNITLSITKDKDFYDIPLFSILTPTYKRYDELKVAIESVMNQTYQNFEMIICSDGYDNEVENIIKEYNSEKIKYSFTEKTNDYGSTQRNYLTKISNGKYLIYLDDDNVIYQNCLQTIVDNLDSNTGMIIFKIDYDGLDHNLPIGNEIILGKIDTLNIVVDKYYTKYAIWYNYVGHDYEFIKICENNIINHNKNIKFIPNILGRHIDKSKIISKECIIMTSHPNFKTSEDITKQALESLKSLNIDTILCTHCPTSPDLQKAATHFLFDKNNPLIRHDYYEQSWFDKEDYYSLIKLHKNDNDLQHALAVYLNYYNGILHAKSLGYKTAICTNFDMIFHEDDLNIIRRKVNEMNQTGKKSFYLTSNANEGIHYKTIFFITNIDFFIENFKYVTNENDYNLLTRKVGSHTNCLENFFYQTLKSKSDQLLLQQIEEKDLFSKSRINLFSNIEYFTILPLRNDDEHFVIWFSSSNSFDDNRHLTIKVFKDFEGSYLKNDIITKNYIFFHKVKFEKNHMYNISCEITYNGDIKKRNIIINNESFDKLKENGEFWDKKGILE